MGSISNPSGSITAPFATGLSNPIGSITTGNGIIFLDGNGVISSLITYTQSGNLTYFDSAGVLRTAAVDTLPFEYNPVTLAARGYPFWPARTNSLRNNTMVGAVVGVIGAGGALPTNWLFTVNTTLGLVREVVAIGTEDGIDYIDLRLSGTAIGAGSVDFIFEPTTQIVATQNQVWTSSIFRKLAAGSFTGISNTATALYLNSYTAAGAFDALSTSTVRTEATPTSAALRTQRAILTGTLASATTARADAGIFMNIANGAAVDFTLRIGLPDLELGAFASAVIKTAGTAVSRAVPTARIFGANLTSFYNALQGTFFGMAEYAGISTTPNSSLMTVSDGTAANRIDVRASGTAALRFGGDVATVNQWALTTGNILADNTPFGFAFRYKLNDVMGYVNGANQLQDTSCTIPAVTQLNIGENFTPTPMGGWLKTFGYFNVAQPAATLAALST